jgi:hypothetical protein
MTDDSLTADDSSGFFALASVRRATQRNAGRKTAGIDREVALTARPGWTWRCGCTVPSGPGPQILRVPAGP